MRTALAFLSILLLLASCDPTSPGTLTVFDRTYSPDHQKFIARYAFVQGAWDGGRSYAYTLLREGDSLPREHPGYVLSSLDCDSLCWKGSDTLIVLENFPQYKSQGPQLRDTNYLGVQVRIVRQDPIDSTYKREVLFRKASPDGRREVAAYRYVRADIHNPFLNISIVNTGDSLPKYGNFYITRYDFDCINNVRWDSAGKLRLDVSEGCFYAMDGYLVKDRPAVPLDVHISEERGNATRQ